MAGSEDWTVERANESLPRIGTALTRIRELAAQARREREETAGLLEGNGHPATPRGTGELRAAGAAPAPQGGAPRGLRAGRGPARAADRPPSVVGWGAGDAGARVVARAGGRVRGPPPAVGPAGLAAGPRPR